MRALGFSLFAKQFLEIFDEADQNHHGRSYKANKKHRLKEPYCKNGEDHEKNCNRFPASDSGK